MIWAYLLFASPLLVRGVTAFRRQQYKIASICAICLGLAGWMSSITLRPVWSFVEPLALWERPFKPLTEWLHALTK